MTCLAIIPTKALAEGKSRLADVLDSAARQSLSRAMLLRVYNAVAAAANIAGVMVAGSGHNGLPSDLPHVPSTGLGLNADLAAALDAAKARNAARIVVVAGDLPLLTTRDAELLAATADGAIAIAPDRHGTGTNALSLPLPQAGGFSFAFGPDSYARHRAEAQRLGLRFEEVHSRGLAHDIDEPSDLGDVEDLIGSSG